MLSYETERKLETLLSAFPLPAENREANDQPRDEKGRYTEIPEALKSDYDKVTWEPIGGGVYVRRRKMRYVLADVMILGVVLGIVFIIF